jgi:uncharacterized protein YvpB
MQSTRIHIYTRIRVCRYECTRSTYAHTDTLLTTHNTHHCPIIRTLHFTTHTAYHHHYKRPQLSTPCEVVPVAMLVCYQETGILLATRLRVCACVFYCGCDCGSLAHTLNHSLTHTLTPVRLAASLATAATQFPYCVHLACV